MAPGQEQRPEQQRPGDHHQPVGDRLTHALAHGGGSVRRPDDLVRSSRTPAPPRNLSLQMATNGHRTAFRTCPLCEATCGLELTLGRDEPRLDPRRRARTCSATASSAPRAPRSRSCTRTPTGSAHAADPATATTSAPPSWDEAFALIDARLSPDPGRRPQRGRRLPRQPERPQPRQPALRPRAAQGAVAPATSTRPARVDQIPKQLASALMFGTGTTVPVPDVDRTDHLLMLGANPLASNGSLMTAPDMRGRLRALRARGGKLVVIDPRRTRTAEEADEHHFIRPGTDALLLFALVHVLFERGPGRPRRAAGRAHRRPRRGPRAGRAVHARGGRAAPAGSRRGEIRRLARELAAAPTAAVYGRIGTCTAGVRHAGQLAGRRAQRADRQPRPRGRRDVPAGRRRPLQRRRRARPRPRRAPRALRQPRARAGRGLRRAAGGVPGRGDRDPGRGPGPRADHAGRQPGPLHAEQRPSRRRPGARSTSWSASTSTSTRPRATPT